VFDLPIGEQVGAVCDAESHPLVNCETDECLVHSREMTRSVVCQREQDPQQQSPDRQLPSASHSWEHVLDHLRDTRAVDHIFCAAKGVCQHLPALCVNLA
jgi:hypothetical protein